MRRKRRTPESCPWKDFMSNWPERYLQKCIALVLVAGIAASGTWLIDALLCLFRECVEDDASRRADAMIGIPVFVAYVVLTWVVVFLPALGLRRRFPKLIAAATPAVVVAVGLSSLFFDAEYDGLPGALGLALWFTGPWLIANLVGLTIWPSQEAGTARAEIDCFD